MASAFARAVAEAHIHETEVAISGLGTADRRVLETLRAAGVQARVFPDADRALEWADALGLAAYAVFGTAKALSFGIGPLPAALPA